MSQVQKQRKATASAAVAAPVVEVDASESEEKAEQEWTEPNDPSPTDIDVAIADGAAQNDTDSSDTETVLKALRTEAGGDSTLSKYFREMAQHRVLTPQEEVAAAQKVERLEIAYWEALFSYSPAYETVASVLERQLEQKPEELESLRKLSEAAKATSMRSTGANAKKTESPKWTSTAAAFSKQLRVLDSDRLFVTESDRAVHRLAGMYESERDIEGDDIRITAAFKKYLSRVDAARRGDPRIGAGRRAGQLVDRCTQGMPKCLMGSASAQTHDQPVSHRHTTGFCIQAALISGRDPEQGIPFSWTQPGGIGGHGVPSGRTQDCSGPA